MSVRHFACLLLGVVGLLALACAPKSTTTTNNSNAETQPSTTDQGTGSPDTSTGNEETISPTADAKDGTTGNEENGECDVPDDCKTKITITNCQELACLAKKCVAKNLDLGTVCQDGDGCTLDDRCDGNGTCVAGKETKPCDVQGGDGCKVGGVCVSDGNETAHCDYAKTEGTPCDDGKECTTATCVSGICTTATQKQFGEVCTSRVIPKEGICSETQNCLTLHPWANTLLPDGKTHYMNGQFMTFSRTSDGKVWMIYLSLPSEVGCALPGTTCSYAFRGEIDIFEVGADGMPIKPGQEKVVDWTRLYIPAHPNTEPAPAGPRNLPDVRCHRDTCLILDGATGYNEKDQKLTGLLYGLQYDSGAWKPAPTLVDAVRLAAENGKAGQYYKIQRLLTASQETAADGTRHFLFGGRTELEWKTPVGPCTAGCERDDHVLVCTLPEKGVTSCAFELATDTHATPGGVPLEFATTRLFGWPDGDTSIEVFSLTAVLQNAYAIAGGQWQLMHRKSGGWGIGDGCMGLGATTNCYHDFGFDLYPLATEVRDAMGMHDAHGRKTTNAPQLYVVGEALQKESHPIGTSTVYHGVFYEKVGNEWKARQPGTELLATTDLPTLSQTTIIHFNAVRAVNDNSVLVQGFRLSCAGEYKECVSGAKLRIVQPFIIIYRPQTQSFEKAIPIGTPYKCCDACNDGAPKCSEPGTGTEADFSNQRDFWRIGPWVKQLTVSDDRERVYLFGTDSYRILKTGENGLAEEAVWFYHKPTK